MGGAGGGRGAGSGVTLALEEGGKQRPRQPARGAGAGAAAVGTAEVMAGGDAARLQCRARASRNDSGALGKSEEMGKCSGVRQVATQASIRVLREILSPPAGGCFFILYACLLLQRP